ncbi:hypothetical protein F9C07_1064 [Aspergillus flavus]|uniref:Uncharacterized protein n=1 Tax=Aspergillus flavus (strain ATCC 200026 / FGSC A1120 / IAM 13836 / NRRL 3357 / JCM 12722 / SRRC 167) TaxID=332952 RepID=A0A7U2MQP6_ASPFN|nr:hypothetical protein F9C07_1064 [Aspergillus flavus]
MPRSSTGPNPLLQSTLHGTKVSEEIKMESHDLESLSPDLLHFESDRLSTN